MSIAIRPAVESDIAELSHAMAGDVSPEQLSNRWQEHIVSYRVVLVALLDGDLRAPSAWAVTITDDPTPYGFSPWTQLLLCGDVA